MVMGHSNLIVSMTYLRALGVSELKFDDIQNILIFVNNKFL